MCATVTHQQEGKEQLLSSHLYIRYSLHVVPVTALLCTLKRAGGRQCCQLNHKLPLLHCYQPGQSFAKSIFCHISLRCSWTRNQPAFQYYICPLLEFPQVPPPRAELPMHQHPSRPGSAFAHRQQGSPQQTTPSCVLSYKGKLLLPHFSSSTLQPRLAGRWSAPPN